MKQHMMLNKFKKNPQKTTQIDSQNCRSKSGRLAYNEKPSIIIIQVPSACNAWQRMKIQITLACFKVILKSSWIKPFFTFLVKRMTVHYTLHKETAFYFLRVQLRHQLKDVLIIFALPHVLMCELFYPQLSMNSVTSFYTVSMPQVHKSFRSRQPSNSETNHF